MNEIKIFESQELGFNVRTVLNSDGSISVNAEDTANGYGWSRTEMKNGREYNSIMWARMNNYCKELGFAHECAKDDYIPESLFYMLGFKAGNDRALKYQQWLAMEVLPLLRKTGSYEIAGLKRLSATEQMKLHQQAILEVDEKVDAIDKDLQSFKQDLPILGVETAKITSAINKKGVRCLCGKDSSAYKDRSIRGKVYSDIYGQLKRELGIPPSCTYKIIKRSQCELVISIVEAYELPMDLRNKIEILNEFDELLL